VTAAVVRCLVASPENEGHLHHLVRRTDELGRYEVNLRVDDKVPVVRVHHVHRATINVLVPDDGNAIEGEVGEASLACFRIHQAFQRQAGRIELVEDCASR